MKAAWEARVESARAMILQGIADRVIRAEHGSAVLEEARKVCWILKFREAGRLARQRIAESQGRELRKCACDSCRTGKPIEFLPTGGACRFAPQCRPAQRKRIKARANRRYTEKKLHNRQGASA